MGGAGMTVKEFKEELEYYEDDMEMDADMRGEEE